MNIYELEFTSRCPNDETIDKYNIEFIGLEFVEAEELISYLRKFKNRHIFQEDIADEIAKEYKCKTIIIGLHQGVKITTERNYD